MKWLKVWKIGQVALAVLEAEGVNVKGIPIGTIHGAVEKGVKIAAQEIRSGKA